MNICNFCKETHLESVCPHCVEAKKTVKEAIENTDFTADTELEREAIKLKLFKRLDL